MNFFSFFPHAAKSPDDVLLVLVREGLELCEVVGDFTSSVAPFVLALFSYFLLSGILYGFSALEPLVSSFNAVKSLVAAAHLLFSFVLLESVVR